MLRVNKDGTIPADNPFVDGGGPNVDAIWARGLRNPYRFSWDPVTAKMYIGDVGFNTTEELNVGAAGANYGWPTCEGSCVTAGMTNPIFSVPRIAGATRPSRRLRVTGERSSRPLPGRVSSIGDFAQNWIRYLTLNAAGVVTGTRLPAGRRLGGRAFDPIMLKPGPEGLLYYVDFGWGWLSEVNPAAIRRMRYAAGNQPPSWWRRRRRPATARRRCR